VTDVLICVSASETAFKGLSKGPLAAKYTVSHKETCHFLFRYNSGISCAIFTILYKYTQEWIVLQFTYWLDAVITASHCMPWNCNCNCSNVILTFKVTIAVDHFLECTPSKQLSAAFTGSGPIFAFSNSCRYILYHVSLWAENILHSVIPTGFVIQNSTYLILRSNSMNLNLTTCEVM